jgi:hypothetical protein
VFVSSLERPRDLLRPLHIIPMRVDRRRRYRCVTDVVPHGRQFGFVRKGVRRVAMPIRVTRCASLHWRCYAGNSSFRCRSHDAAVVHQPVQQCRGHLRVAERTGPFGEVEI